MIPPLPEHETADAADARRFRFLLSLGSACAAALLAPTKPPRNIRRTLDRMQREEVAEFNRAAEAREAGIRG